VILLPAISQLTYQQNAWNDVWCSNKCRKAIYLKHCISRAWCKTIVTSYIKWGSYNSFAPSPRFVLSQRYTNNCLLTGLNAVLHYVVTSIPALGQTKCHFKCSARHVVDTSTDRLHWKQQVRCTLKKSRASCLIPGATGTWCCGWRVACGLLTTPQSCVGPDLTFVLSKEGNSKH